MTPRALRSLWPLLALACACDASWQGAPTATFPARYELSLIGPTAPFQGPRPLITALPDPPDGTLEVRFALDGVVQAVDLTAPYATTLDLLHEWGGTRRLTATAHRADGAVARASIDLDYDPLGPFVTLTSPAAGTRVAPEGGSLDVSFLASDPYGLTSGGVQIGAAAPVSIPLPALGLTVPVPATTAELPATSELRYWLDDATGNRTEGTMPFVQTHERFTLGLGGGGTVTALPGGRLAVVSGTGALRVVEADGSVAWTRAAADTAIIAVFPAAGGDLLVARQIPGFSGTLASVERLHADGSLLWSWPTPGQQATDATYVAAADGLLAVRRTDDFTSMVAVLVDASGAETELLTAGTDQLLVLSATPASAAPPGFAVGITTWTIDPSPAHVAIFDAAGAPAWSVDLPAPQDLGGILTRDAIVVRTPSSTGYWRSIVTAGGTTADLGLAYRIALAPNGDVLATALPPTGPETVSRVTPTGSVLWQVSADDWVTDVVAAGDRVAVSTATQVHVVDAAGGSVPWLPSAQGVLYVPQLPRAVLGPTGAFYVFDQGSTGKVRVHRVGEDGVTRWHETLDGVNASGVLADDGKLALTLMAGDGAVRVFAP